MKEATNITPIENWEEGIYNFLSVLSISGFVGSLILISHMLIFHAMFSYFYVVLSLIFLSGCILFPWLKSRRFGEKNMSLAERIVNLEVKLERALGVDVA